MIPYTAYIHQHRQQLSKLDAATRKIPSLTVPGKKIRPHRQENDLRTPLSPLLRSCPPVTGIQKFKTILPLSPGNADHTLPKEYRFPVRSRIRQYLKPHTLLPERVQGWFYSPSACIIY